MKLLPVEAAHKIEELNDERRWLVENLWSEEAVGMIGGVPKVGKSWLALDIALSVATATPALGVYPVAQPGPVLVFAAEDSPEAVKERLLGMATHRGIRLEDAPIYLILSHVLRLDSAEDQERLTNTVSLYAPRLLILDPFIRCHRIDENSAQEVSAVLGYLRALQRRYAVAILIVHHTRKAGASTDQGLSLRGSGDLWAFGDSNLYIRKKHGVLELTTEHRNAAPITPVHLALTSDGDAPYLSVVAAPDADQVAVPTVEERILKMLRHAQSPTSQEEIRAVLKVRTEHVVAALRALERAETVRRSRRGWILASANTTQSG